MNIYPSICICGLTIQQLLGWSSRYLLCYWSSGLTSRHKLLSQLSSARFEQSTLSVSTCTSAGFVVIKCMLKAGLISCRLAVWSFLCCYAKGEITFFQRGHQLRSCELKEFWDVLFTAAIMLPASPVQFTTIQININWQTG